MNTTGSFTTAERKIVEQKILDGRSLAARLAGRIIGGLLAGSAFLLLSLPVLGLVLCLTWILGSCTLVLREQIRYRRLLDATGELRTIVTFRSDAFNLSEERPHYINPECYGDDLAAWLIERLTERGIQCEQEPGQEDFGWYIVYHVNENVNETPYCLVISHSYDDRDDCLWFLTLERHRGFLSSVLGKRQDGILREGLEPIHAVLENDPAITDLRWHFPFVFAHDPTGSPAPFPG